MGEPVRIQLSRRKGFRLQEHSRAINGLEAVKVDRTTRWGNPYAIGNVGKMRCATVAEAVAAYRQMVTDSRRTSLQAHVISPLKGKNLACWCAPDDPCHADVLIEIANADQVPPPGGGG